MVVRYKPGGQMFVADHLSRAPLPAREEMTDNFQVFALELETLTPFDSISVSRKTSIATEMHCSRQPSKLQS